MSPIERKMLEELQRRAVSVSRDEVDCSDDFIDDMLRAHGYEPRSTDARIGPWAVIQEQPVDGYRLDFAIISDAGQVCVECDGHDYHERTAAQATHDRKRDRYLQMEGWHVVRFTGTEIVRDVVGCVDELMALLDKMKAAEERRFRAWRELYDLAHAHGRGEKT